MNYDLTFGLTKVVSCFQLTLSLSREYHVVESLHIGWPIAVVELAPM